MELNAVEVTTEPPFAVLAPLRGLGKGWQRETHKSQVQAGLPSQKNLKCKTNKTDLSIRIWFLGPHCTYSSMAVCSRSSRSAFQRGGGKGLTTFVRLWPLVDSPHSGEWPHTHKCMVSPIGCNELFFLKEDMHLGWGSGREVRTDLGDAGEGT